MIGVLSYIILYLMIGCVISMIWTRCCDGDTPQLPTNLVASVIVIILQLLFAPIIVAIALIAGIIEVCINALFGTK